jgi:hypothetical protein
MKHNRLLYQMVNRLATPTGTSPGLEGPLELWEHVLERRI